MSNNFVSHHYQFPGRQMVQMEHGSDRVDSMAVDMQKQVLGHVSYNSNPPHFSSSNDQFGPAAGFPNLMVSNNQLRQMEPNARVPEFGGNGVMPTSVGLGVMPTSVGLGLENSLPSKRKAEFEMVANDYVPQQQAVPNKRLAQMGAPPHFTHSVPSAASNKKAVQIQSKLVTSTGQSPVVINKKLVRNESSLNKSGNHKVQTPKSRTMQYEPNPKKQVESHGGVRAKMREQLAAALALALQNQDKSSNAGKNAEACGGNLLTSDPKHPGSDSNSEKHGLQEFGEAIHGESCSTGKAEECQGFSGDLSTSGGLNKPAESCNVLHCGLPDEDISFSDNFFVKDELLQGNGLSWALDLDMGATEAKNDHISEKEENAQEVAGVDAREQKRASPEHLALEIEAELFKLFGGVNKKYKERGRSLLFNLKDRNNPELRERVMSGEIPPERLCSMTAEELASKELSEWRMAKAEELAQMVVLPDTDFDRRRLVKKTHKGEYQVEMDEDDGNLVEVSGGVPSPSQTRPGSKDTELGSSKNKGDIQNRENPVNPEVSDSLVIPSDGTDLMQGMMVDVLKDAEFLPPIISLDEFMESLHSEPPFETLRVNATERSTATSEKDNYMADDGLANHDLASKVLGDDPSDKTDETVGVHTVDPAAKPKESPVEEKISPPVNSSKNEHTWEGTLQLNISSSIIMQGVLRSGEKTSMLEWPNSLEIKGRVRLDAFQKFIKELPNSRSRAVMVISLDLKDKSSDSERANLQEAVDSYVSEERLGYAEPGPGVELYLCPPKEKMVDMLCNYLSKDRTDILDSTDNGLIGIVVWRRPHTGSLISSPNSSSHNKHSSKRQHITSRRQEEKDANVNTNMTKVPASYNRPASRPERPQHDEDDSDIPPGFGPQAGRSSRDDDDLPEFNFSGNVRPNIHRTVAQNAPQGLRVQPFNSPQVASRPVDQIRQLIHKYGHTSSSDSDRTWLDNRGLASGGLGIEPWDDDDDIPEWRPQAPQLQLQPQHMHQPLQPHFGNQHHLPTVVHQQLNPVGSPSPQQKGGRWPLPPSNSSGQLNEGQFYWIPSLQAGQRQDSSRTRGF